MKQIYFRYILIIFLPIFLLASIHIYASKVKGISLDLRDNKSSHLFEIINADHAFRRQIVEHAAFELSNERENVEMVTYLLDVPRHLEINLEDSKKRGLFLQNFEYTVVQTYLNHRLVMNGQGPHSTYDDLMNYYKKKMLEFMERSYQPTCFFALKEFNYRSHDSIEVRFVVQQNLEPKLLESLRLVSMLVIDPMPSYTIPDSSYNHKNVAVQSLSLTTSDAIFDGSGYKLTDIVDIASLSQGEEIKLTFDVTLPSISWDGQWKVIFILENHQQRTQFGTWIKLL